ncbi:RNA polymerase factor sigma-54 [Natranaerobius thermophilus]|uniref:RNA polymerase, sigma 54 subunit, RpoN n=1 Tax=Natranaerobius thermophilus (strain ATCC BAA-1301 / DSM 18059 / JW/NM-WN-LF) TaxID=457570 RepID=B2A6Z6_NATTJ|nr:RNA polymerase factor sigma-54 [Natranaerobius thermophilus]ACB85587.1 RNA polymerase, sigma 54 subunit, RpoN [Natranaerobius thermophilus JW/NM-WN-LF]
MKLGFDLNLEQKQQLVITPELRKAIKLLQLSSIELDNYIEKELVENPMLEISSTEESESGDDNGKEDSVEKLENSQESAQSEDRFDIDWQKYFEDSSDVGKYNNLPKENYDEGKDGFETFTPSTISLTEHLYFQLSLYSDQEEHIKPLAEFLIGNLDANGYLNGTLQEIAEFLDVEEKELEKALELVQSLDPPGVGARSLKECLLLQVETDSHSPDSAYELIENFLSEIAENRLDKIAKELKLPIKEVQEIVDYIRSLTPKPASPFSEEGLPSYITPDIVIKRVEDEYEIILNDSMSPRLKINSKYRQLLKTEKGSGVAKFLNSRLDSAMWLIKSIEQRRITLYNIMQKLVEMQRPFLDNGVRYLKPLTLKEVADEIDVHESTVSRATANKYVQTPQGVYPLRFFFSSKLDNNQDDYNSSTSIKQKIKELVEEEDKKKPLSDQKIAEILQESSINISRRTVAKYRKELNLPSSSKRKRY